MAGFVYIMLSGCNSDLFLVCFNRKAFVIVEGEFQPAYAAKCGMRGKVLKIEKNPKYQGLGTNS